jgi:hypothetical protein
MFGISQLVRHWLGSDRISEMAERVAGRSRLQVWQRVASRLQQLGASEARGYLRSRAIGVVREETSRLASQEGGHVQRLQVEIAAAALEQLIASITAQLQEHRLATARRAA